MNQTEATSIVTALNRAGLVQAMEGQAAIWAMGLEDVSYVTAQEVARDMITNRTSDQRWVTPGDIRAEVKRIRKGREAGLDDVVPPAELADDVAGTISWTRAYRAARCDGDPDDLAIKRACAAVGIEVPAVIEGGRAMPAVGHLTRRVPGEAS